MSSMSIKLKVERDECACLGNTFGVSWVPSVVNEIQVESSNNFANNSYK